MTKEPERKHIEKGIYTRGNTWYISFSMNGRQKKEAVGKVNEVTKSMVRNVLAKRKADIATHRIENEHDIKVKKNKISMAEIFDDYLDYQENNNEPNTCRINRNSVKFLSKHFVSVTDIHTVGFERYKKQRKDVDNYSCRSIDIELQTLNSAIAYAVKCNKISDKYLNAKAKLYRADNRNTDFISDEEILNIIKTVEPLSYLHTLVVVAINQGFRKAELLSIKWKNLYVARETITIESSKTSKVPQSFHLHQETIKHLLALKSHYETIKPELLSEKDKLEGLDELTHRQRKRLSVITRALKRIDSDYLITVTGGKLRSPSKGWKSLLEEAGVQHYRIHDLRHTYASRMLMGGATLHDLLQTGLWKDYDSLLRYAHLEGSYLKDKLNKVSMPATTDRKVINFPIMRTN